MNSAEYELLSSLFDSALALPQAQREQFIRSRCPTDDLRRQLRRMLDSDEQAEDLSASTRVLSEALSTALTPADDDIPEAIGPYRLIRQIAVGGMGVVYLAEQSSPRRTVAIKLLRADIRDEPLVRHFEREASILARLRHAGIAHVYDAGMLHTQAGARPYLVIEYIEGRGIDAYARERGLGVGEKVGLLIQACDAVEHAHSRGVIHRDLKPGNLLVTAEGAVKVLDFGIARIVSAEPAPLPSIPSDARSARGTTMTLPHLLGTLSYMAPEQLEPGGGDVDTRADVYALGVVLFELLTGRLPIETHGMGLRAGIEAVRRGSAPRIGSIDRKLRGDLEHIVAAALAHDPEARYASAAALGDDLRRLLEDRPISARPPSLAYAFSKAAKRHRLTFVACGTALLVLAIGGPIVAISAADLARERGARLSMAEQTLEASRLYEQASDLIQRGIQVDHARRLLDRAVATNPQFSLAYAARSRLDLPSWHEMRLTKNTARALGAVRDLLTAHSAAGGTIPDIPGELTQAAREAAPREKISGGRGFPDALQSAGETLVWLGLALRDSAEAGDVNRYLGEGAECLRTAASSSGSAERATLARAWIHLASFERIDAETALDELAALPGSPQVESAQRARGILLSRDYRQKAEPINTSADPVAAEGAWIAVLRSSPSDVEALAQVAEAQRAQRKFDDALRNYSRAFELSPADSSLCRGKAWVLRDAGRFEEAAEQFGNAANFSTRPERNWFLAGDCFRRAGQLDQALLCFNIHMTFYPTDGFALGEYVDTLINNGRASEARGAVEQFASASADAALVREFEQYVLLKESNPGVTLSQVLTGESEQPGLEDEDRWVRLADAYISAGWYNEAADALQCAADDGARTPPIILRAIAVHLRTGDRASAKQTAAALLGRQDIPPATWAGIARDLDNLSLSDEAILAAERAHQADPAQRPYTDLLAGMLLHCRETQCRDPQRAADLLEPVARQADATVAELDDYAESLMRLGRYRAARGIAERALAINADEPRRRLWIAIAAAAAGERAVAQDQLRSVAQMLDRTPSDEDREELVQSLQPWYSQAQSLLEPEDGVPFQ